MDAYTFWMTVFFIFTAVLSVVLHYHFVSSSYKHVPVVTHVMLVFSIFTCIAPFPLLVLDVEAALSTPSGQQHSPFAATAFPWWLFLFIASQVMAWIALPIAQAYDVGGERDVGDRLKGAIRVNVKMYLILGILVGSLLAYIMFLKNAHSFNDVLHVTIAAANAFGLFLLVVFLACGLLGIPRRLWKMADAEALLEEQYRRARALYDELDVAKTDVVLLRGEATAIRDSNNTTSGVAKTEEDRAFLDEIIASITSFETEVPLQQQSRQQQQQQQLAAAAGGDGDRQHQTLVELNEDIMSAIKVCRRLNFQWHECVQECIHLSNVVAGTVNSLYWKAIRKPLMRVGCASSIILTAIVLFSELVVPFQTLDASRQISIVEMMLQTPETRFFSAIVVLAYMGICGYWAIFQFHVFDLFVVVPRISDAASLCFVVTFLTRLVLPLCYNFLWIADLTNSNSASSTLVTYSEVFGKMDVVDFLGKWFNRFMPVFIPVLAILIEAKVIHRFLNWVGVEGFETGEESDAARRQAVEEGRSIVAREANMEMRAVHPHGGGAGSPAAGGVDANSNTHAVSPATSPAGPVVAAHQVEFPPGGGGGTPSSGGIMTDERKRRYETWKAAHGGGAAGAAAVDVGNPV